MSSPATSASGGETPKQKLQELLKLMGFVTTVDQYEEKDGEILLHVSTPDAALLIGRNGQGLEALQIVLNRMLQTTSEQRVHYIVDIERYRERRKDKLLKMAFDAATRVEQTGRSVRLPPMSAHDRRIVHQALKDRPGIKTASEPGREKGEKCVVISRA